MGIAEEQEAELSGEDMIQQALGEEPEVIEHEKPERKLSAIEQEAIEGGWMPKDEWLEANPDKDPEIWSSARDFVKYGKLQAAMREQAERHDKKAKEFDERLENVNKFHQAQLEAQILTQRQLMREAVSEADGEGYDAAQKRLEHLESQKQIASPASVPTKDAAIQAWEEKNSWIDDLDDPRTIIAQGAFSVYQAKNRGASYEEILRHVDKEVAKISSNPRREAAANTETAQRQSPRSKGRSLTMNDLTSEERDMWKMTGSSMWNNDEAKFLKVCADARKGA